jgi:predicted nucleotidyltransferase component of viral defense system
MKEVLEIIANKLNVEPALPEKEAFVVQIIKKVAEELRIDNGIIVFGGGTCLSCGHKIIKRFSEDIDFRFVPNEKITHTKEIRDQIKKFVENLPGFEIIGEIGEDSHKIEFNLSYAKNPEFSKRSSLREHIKAEFYFSGPLNFYPVLRPIISLCNEFSDLPPETEILCVALEEIFIEKTSSLLWRIGTKDYQPTHIRHLHDLARIGGKISTGGDFKEIFRNVFGRDLKRKKSEKTISAEISESLAELSDNKRHAADYDKFVNGMSYADESERLSFYDALSQFKTLLSAII